MADEERQDQPEGQEPEEAAPEAQAGDADGGAPEDAPAADTGNGEEPAPEQEEAPAPEAVEQETPDEPAAEEPAPEEPAADAPAAEEDAAPEEAAAEDAEPEAAEQPRQRRGRGRDSGDQQEEVIPGAHLEPDLVLEEQQAESAESEFGEAGAAYADDEADAEPSDDGEEPETPVAREPLDLAADARYAATGKRKTAVARVILKPGDGVYTINGRHLDQFFPRVRLQRMAQQPLETAGYNGRMDVVARIHGGGVSAQAGALRHGIARALVEADPNLRVELKRRGFLTRDPREKERKKAGLKKARKRPQFSKR
jgi:small subunit ribosomal protein S9